MTGNRLLNEIERVNGSLQIVCHGVISKFNKLKKFDRQLKACCEKKFRF